MIRAIQRRAPTRSRIRLLGISKRQYPRKNRPAPMPYCVAVNPRSRWSALAANPMFTRSM
jgi:hypothetical protein